MDKHKAEVETVRQKLNVGQKIRRPSIRKVCMAIRKKCLDCSGGRVAEVRDCELTDCPLFPWRMGEM